MSTLRAPWTKPFLRWAGSKRLLLPELLTTVPREFRCYIEPFAGSACLFFALKPRHAILGDINEELMKVYAVVAKYPRQVARAARQIPDTEQSYLHIRSMDCSQMAPIARAARFIYLNRHCFNGVYRTDRKGAFNVPRGTRTGGIPPESIFYRCAFALRKAELVAGDYQDCLRKAKHGDFVYLDPPYANPNRTTTGEYGPRCFSAVDFPSLWNWLRNLDQNDVHFMLSFSASDLIPSDLPKHWIRRTYPVRRHVSGFAVNRKIVTEVIIMNYSTSIGCLYNEHTNRNYES
jgi:DNA adenine methylase